MTIDGFTIRVSAVPGQPGNPPDPVVNLWSLNDVAEFLYVELTAPLVLNTNYVLEVGFTGTVRSDGYGLYYDFYTGADGNTK